MKKRRSIVVMALTIFVVVSLTLSVVIGYVMYASIKSELLIMAKESGSGTAHLVSGQLEIAETGVNYYKNSLLDLSKTKIQAVVDTAYSAVARFYQYVEDGKLTEDEAKQYAKDYLAALRYDGGEGYIFVVDKNYVMVVHPNASLVGKKLQNLRDPNGIYVIKTLVDEAIKNGDVYLKYMWNKPGYPSEKYFPKLSYARYFEPWGWVIGTGVYIDNINKGAETYAQKIYTIAADTITHFKILNAYPFVLDSKGRIFIHPVYKNGIEFDATKRLLAKDKKTGENIGLKVWKLMQQNKKDFVTLEYWYTKPGHGNRLYKKIGFFHKVEGTSYIAALAFYEDDLNAIATKATLPTLGAFAIFVILMLIITWYILQFVIVKRLRVVEEISQALESGDLTINANVSGRDEIAFIVKGLDDAVSALRDMILSVREASLRIAQKSVDLEKTVDTASTVLTQAVGSFESVSAMVSDVAQYTLNVADNVEALNQSAEEVANAATNLSAFASQIGEMAGEGKDSLLGVIQMIEDTATKTDEAKQVVAQLTQKSEGIGAIVNTISDIAEQTNLLALNAAIEAARAGEAGRGFAVVADEIRKLAENTQQAVGEIAEILRGIKEDAERVNESTRQIAESVENVKVASLQSGEKFENIVDKIMEMNTQVESLAAISEEQSATTSEVKSAIDQMVETMKSVDSSVSSVATDIAGVQDAMMDIKNAVKEFADMAQGVIDKIQQFKV